MELIEKLNVLANKIRQQGSVIHTEEAQVNSSEATISGKVASCAGIALILLFLGSCSADERTCFEQLRDYSENADVRSHLAKMRADDLEMEKLVAEYDKTVAHLPRADQEEVEVQMQKYLLAREKSNCHLLFMVEQGIVE